MTELAFLLDLLLQHKLPKPTREAVAARIKEVESMIKPYAAASAPAYVPMPMPARPQKSLSTQSPSTQAILAEKFTPEEVEKMGGDSSVPTLSFPPAETPPPAPSTPMAAQALQQRQSAIMKAVNAGPFGGKPDDGRASPRKW